MAEITTSPSPARHKGFPFKVKIEARIDEPSRGTQYLVSFIALIVALILGGILIIFAGGDPIRSYIHIAKASFGNVGVL